jgi:hypothetical protein
MIASSVNPKRRWTSVRTVRAAPSIWPFSGTRFNSFQLSSSFRGRVSCSHLTPRARHSRSRLLWRLPATWLPRSQRLIWVLLILLSLASCSWDQPRCLR